MYWKFGVFAAVLFACVLFLEIGDVDAARFGGGKSFGGAPSMSKSFSAPSSGLGTRQTPPAGQNAPSSGMSAPGSRFGGMGGILGGLLAGSLIGSLLFGNGFHGGGFMDILLIGLAVYFGFKLLAMFRRPAPAEGPKYQDYSSREADAPEPMQRTGGSAWDQLRGQPPSGNIDTPRSSAIPADFDSEEFLRGAKIAYTRLQASWD